MDKKKAMAELANRVRAAGLRRTGGRVAVLERLTNAKTPLTHGEIAASLKDSGIDQATVYRNLMDLSEAGLVNRTDLGDHVWRFELRRDDEGHARKHPHLICADCGKVSCLPDVTVQVKGMPGGKRAGELEVQLKGLCEHCQA